MIVEQRTFSPRPRAFIGGIPTFETSWFTAPFLSHPDQEQAGTFPRKRARCRTCAFTGGTASINRTNGVVHFKGRHSCTTFVPAVKFCTLGKLVADSQTDSASISTLWKTISITKGIGKGDSRLPNISTNRATTQSTTFRCPL